MKIITGLLFLLITGCSTNNERSFEFTYEVYLEPSNAGKIELWLPIPQSNEAQNISNININTDLLYEIKKEKKHGNTYLYAYSYREINKSTKVVMTFNVTRKEHKNEFYAGAIPANYLGPYSTVPTGVIFKTIIDKNKLSKDNIRGIYNFVLSGMHYGKPKNVGDKYYKEPWLSGSDLYGIKKVSRDKVVALYQTSKKENSNYTFGNGNSIYACDIGVGNCTDYHSYFMSLGRSLGIPVRFHMGFPIPDGEEGYVAGYHCWADYYVEEEGWSPVDISEADKNPSRKDYFFGTAPNNRVDMVIGRDLILDEYDNGKLNLFIYPVLEVDDKLSLEYKKKFSYKNL